jgi:hypothetical protein
MHCCLPLRVGAVIAALAAIAPGFAQVVTDTPASPSAPVPNAVERAAFAKQLEVATIAVSASFQASLAQFTAQADALESRHATVLGAVTTSKSSKAVEDCVRGTQGAEDRALEASFRQEVAKYQAGVIRQRDATVLVYQKKFPGDPVGAADIAAQFAALGNSIALSTERAIRTSLYRQ